METISVITELISGLTEWVTGFTTMLVSLFNGFINLFYDSTTGLTLFGAIGIMGIAVGLVYLGLNFVRGFFR